MAEEQMIILAFDVPLLKHVSCHATVACHVVTSYDAISCDCISISFLIVTYRYVL